MRVVIAFLCAALPFTAATAALADAKKPADVRGLRAQALSSEMKPRREALKALVALGTPEAAHALLAAAEAAEKRDDHIGVSDVSHALKQLSSPAMARPLREALARGQPARVRAAIATTLGKLGDEESAPLLRKLSQSDDRQLAWAAYVALAACTRERADVERILADARKEESRSVAALRELRDPSLASALYPVLRDPSAPNQVVHAAINVLGRMAEPASAVPLLDVIERDERSWARQAAAQALVSVVEPEHVPRLEKLVMNGQRLVQDAYLAADRRQHWRSLKRLIAQGHRDAVALVYRVASNAHVSDEPLALAALAAKDLSMRRAGIDILGALGTKNAEKILCGELKNDANHFTLRVDAARGLGRNGTDGAIVCLIEAMEIEQRAPQPHRRRYHGNNTWEECIRSLRRITGENLGEDPKAWRTWHRGGLKSGVDGMIAGLSHADAAVRTLAAKRLLEHRERAKAIDALLEATAKERNGEARTQMVKALGAIRDPRAIPVLVTLLEGRGHRSFDEHVALARALDDLGDGRGTASLIEMLESDDENQRELAARALAEVTGEPAHHDMKRWRAWWKTYAERYRSSAR